MTYEETKKVSDEVFLMINKCYDLHEICGSTLLLEIADDLRKQLRSLYAELHKHRLLDKALEGNKKWKILPKNKSS